MKTWIDPLSAKQLKETFREWQESKREMGDRPILTFDEWLAMEKDLAYLSK